MHITASRARLRSLALAAATIAAGIAVLAPAGPASADAVGKPTMIADINATGAGAQIGEIRDTANGMYFTAETPASGHELYYHDSAAGTTTLLEIAPGRESSYPSRLTLAPDGTLIFSAFHPDYGVEVWRSDGTPQGTVLVKDIKPGKPSGDPSGFVKFDGKVYFVADDGSHADNYGSGNELWFTDGTPGGTQMAPIDHQLTYISEVTVFDGAEDRLFMYAVEVGGNDPELWRYTPSTDHADKYDLYPGAANGSPSWITAGANQVFMSAYTAPGNPVLVRVSDPEGPVGFSVDSAPKLPHSFVAVPGADAVYYRARRTTAPNEFTLWSNIANGAAFEYTTAPDPSGISTYLNVAAMFAARGVNGVELWGAFLGSASEVADIVPGSISSWPTHIMQPPGQGHVLAWITRDGLSRLVRITTEAPAVIHEFPNLAPMPFGTSGSPFEPDDAGGWWHVGRSAEAGVSLFHMNAAGTETTPVPSTDLLEGTADSLVQQFWQLGDGVVFTATDGTTTLQPWRYEPSNGSVARLSGASPVDEPMYLHGADVSGGSFFYAGTSVPLENEALYVSNGVPGNSRLVSDTAGDPTFIARSEVTAFKGGVLFAGEKIDASPMNDTEPWFSDGTQAGTYRIADITAGPSGSFPRAFVSLGNVAVFDADGDLWATDGTVNNATKLFDLNDYIEQVAVIETANGPVAYLATGNEGLWRTDGTVTGTTRVVLNADPNLDPPSQDLVAAGSRLYLTAENGEVWTIDTAAGDAAAKVTVPADMLFDIGSGAATGTTLVAAGGHIANGELDSTSTFAFHGTTLIDLGIHPGDFDFDRLGTFASDGETVYFVGSTPANGREIWRTDGTVAGTMLARETAPGAADHDPRQLTVIGDRLYFTADVPGFGREPHVARLIEETIVPVEPTRYWDTRAGQQTFDHQHEATGRVAARTPYRLDIAGRGDVPNGAQAVAANIAVVLPDGPGYATLYPCTAEVPKASHLNYVAGNLLANNAIVPLDANGDVCLYSTQPADFVLDVNGYVDPKAPAVGIQPARYLDTRPGADTNTFDGQFHGPAPVAAETMVKVPIAGRGNVPANATAAIVNVTAVAPQAPGYLTLWPCSEPRPTTSTLNYAPGQIVPNGAVIDLSDDGSVCIFTKARTGIVLDVTGFLTGEMTSVHTMSPARLFDSRPGYPIIDGTAPGPRLAAEQTIEITIAGRGGVDPSARAAFLNVAAVGTDAAGYVTLWPCTDPASTSRPVASNVNYTPGMTRANNVLVRLSDEGTICAFTKAGTDLIVDATGWID